MNICRRSGQVFRRQEYRKGIWHSLRSLALIGSLCSAMAAQASITTPPTEETTNLSVGSTPLTMDVANNGDAVATVPLELIPGVAGFAPELGLEYRSGRPIDRLVQSLPEDTLGYGWRLTGISQIRRCVVNQSTGATIALNNNDSLCLDGVPLVRASGTHLSVGATYRTLIESYRKVEIKGTAGALWFEVTAPDGTVMEYGNGSGSRVDHNGGTDYQWSVNKATSADGNAITYSYTHDAAKGINYPTNIHYAGADIDFEYRSRTDAAAVSIGSASQTQSVFLHTVKVSFNNTAVREYRLLDAVVSGKRRLEKIQQCGYDLLGVSTTCLKPLDIHWQNWGVNPSDIVLWEITDGLGAGDRFYYGSLTGSSHFFLFDSIASPFGAGSLPADTQLRTTSRSVVTALYRDNGKGGYSHTSYGYQGQGVESTKGWGFLGFYAQRIKDQESGIVTLVQHRVDFPHFGSVARVSQYDGLYPWLHTETLDRAETDYANHSKSHSGGNTYYPYAERTAHYIYEGSNTSIGVSETESTFTFDSNGYITQVQSVAKTGTGSTTSGGGGVWGDTPDHTITGELGSRTTTTSFTNRTTGSNWLIGFVDDVTTTSTGGSTVGSLQSQTTFTPHATSLKVANFTRFPGDPNLNLTTTYTYNSLGHTTKTEVSGANVSSRDNQAGEVNGFDVDRYPLNFTNDLGQMIEISGCDLRFGQYTNISDPNNRTTLTSFDPFGRQTDFTNGDGVAVTTTYEDCNSVSCATVNGVAGVYRVKQSSAITPTSYTTYDKLDREIRSESQTLNGSYRYTDTWYDNQGRVEKISLPYLSGDTAYYITPEYDIRNRVTKLTRADGSYTDTTYSTSGNQVVVTVSDRVNSSTGSFVETQTKVSKYNVLGQLVETTDAHGTSKATTTTYEYDAHGHPTTITVNGGSAGTTTTTMEYDVAGNRTKLIGPDVGTVITTYNALGQIRTHKDNKGQETTYNYDTLGRLTVRSTKDALNNTIDTADWVWDTASNGIGLLKSRTNNNGFNEVYNYNSLNKVSSVTTTITAIGAGSGTNFTTSHSYDSHGRPVTTTYPSGYAVTRHYNSQGYLHQLKNGSTVLQTFNGTDAFGNATNESYGNGVATLRTYDPKTGELTSITSDKGSTSIQNLDYSWRSNGTLESRQNIVGSDTRKETFGYDVMNRLTLAETYINGTNTRDLSYQYNLLGNITSKTSDKSGDTDVTGYAYGAGAAGPHAVTSATIDGTAHTLSYDANGAITHYDKAGTTTDRYLAYNYANQPTTIVVGTGINDSSPDAKDEFRYDPDGQRYARKLSWKDGSTTKEEHVSYIGDVEYITYVNNPELDALYKTRIGDNIIVTRAYKTVSGQLKDETDIEYAHRDHLGSVESITDQNGTKLMQLAFEPFGARKKSNWQQNIDATELATIESSTFDYTIPNIRPRVARGFTGHEHLDKTGFIHMNGRVYDPVLGRFLSPDPIVQEPNNSQNWDRYGYVLNNPLNATDPSGYRRRGCRFRGSYFCFKRRNNFISNYWERISRFSINIRFRNHRSRAAQARADAAPAPTYPPGGDIGSSENSGFWRSFGIGIRQLFGVFGLLLSIGPSSPPQTVWRVHGGLAPQDGKYWSTVDPRLVDNYRDAAGLPDGNAGTHLTIGYLLDRTGVVAQPAAPLDGNAGGGIIEYFVPNPRTQIRMLAPIVLEPPL